MLMRSQQRTYGGVHVRDEREIATYLSFTVHKLE